MGPGRELATPGSAVKHITDCAKQIQIRPDILWSLIWVQTVSKCYPQTTPGGKELIKLSEMYILTGNEKNTLLCMLLLLSADFLRLTFSKKNISEKLSLMWVMPMHLHVNQKSYYDDVSNDSETD